MAMHSELTPSKAADRLAIRELFDAYAHCADRRDAEGQKALFTADTRFAVYMAGEGSEPTYVLEGRDALTPVFADLNRYEATTHFNGQSTVSIDGDRATDESYTIAPHLFSEGGSRKIMIASLGRLDAFAKMDGGSDKFAERHLLLDRSETRPSSPGSRSWTARSVGFGADRPQGGINVLAPPSSLLSPSQLAALAEIGEERTAPAGEVLYPVGDRPYPLIAIVEGEVAIVDAAGHEIVRHGASSFLGELNLLSGQTVFVTALVTEPLRYIAVEREAMRTLLFKDGPLSDLVLTTFIARREGLQRVQGIGLEIVGPHSSEATRRMLDFARAIASRSLGERGRSDRAAAGCRWCDCRAERSCAARRRPGLTRPRHRSRARAPRAGRPADRRRRPGRTRRRRLRRLGRPRHPRRRQHRARWPGGSSRRIENYLGFPAGITGTELTSRAVTQARKFDARMATPYRACRSNPAAAPPRATRRRP